MPFDHITRLRALDLATRWRVAAVAVFLAGALAAGVAWLRGDAVPPAAVAMSRLKAQELALERIGGRFAVEAAKFQDWFAARWSGDALPRTILVLTVVAAALCLWIARLADDGTRRPDDRD